MVRHWLETAPPWLIVQSPKHLDLTVGLESGDIEGIALAVALNAIAILSDDHDVRAAAARRGVSVVGTLGILELASYNGFLDFPKVIATLRQIHARFDPELVTLALDRAAANGKKIPTA